MHALFPVTRDIRRFPPKQIETLWSTYQEAFYKQHDSMQIPSIPLKTWSVMREIAYIIDDGNRYRFWNRIPRLKGTWQYFPKKSAHRQ